MKKGEFYILSQPERAILSIVLVDSPFPLTSEVHQRLGELQEVSDIMFLFSDTSNISAQTFGSLYQACGYIEARPGELAETLVRIFEYDREIFGSHQLTMYTQTSDFTEVTSDLLQEIAASSLIKPIFKTRRLESAEFYKIYKKTATDPKKGFIDKYFPLYYLFHSEDYDEDTGMENLYSIYTSTSKELLYRPISLGKILDFWRDPDKNGEGYVNSFTNPDLRYFLASINKKLRLSSLEINATDYGK